MAQTYTKEKIDELLADAEGTEVIANPTLEGTESALTGLQVGDTKYKVESGGGVYLHRLTVTRAGLYRAFLAIYLSSSSPITSATDLWSLLQNFPQTPARDTGHGLECSIYSSWGQTTQTHMGYIVVLGTSASPLLYIYEQTFSLNESVLSVAWTERTGGKLSNFTIQDEVFSV